MGICRTNSCCKDYEVIRTNENINYQSTVNNSNSNNNNKEKLFLFNDKSVNKGQFHLNKQYFQILFFQWFFYIIFISARKKNWEIKWF